MSYLTTQTIFASKQLQILFPPFCSRIPTESQLVPFIFPYARSIKTYVGETTVRFNKKEEGKIEAITHVGKYFQIHDNSMLLCVMWVA